MLAFLLHQRMRLFWNRLRRGPRRGRAVFGTLFAVGFAFWFIAVAGLNAGAIIQRLNSADPSLTGQALALLLVGIVGLTFLSSVSSAFHHLFAASDLELLLAAPVRPRTLFWLKVAEIWRDSVYVLLFQAAALIGFGRALNMGPDYYALAFLAGFTLSVAACAAAALLTLLLARVRFGESILGVARLATLLFFLPVGILGVPAVGFGGRSRVSLLVSQGNIQSLADSLRDIGPPPTWAPTTWATHLLLGDDSAFVSAGLLVALTAIAVALSHRTFDALYVGGWERVRFTPPRLQPAKPHTRRLTVSGPIAGVLQKDWRMLVRDPRWRTNALISLVALGLPALLLFAGDPFARAQHATRFWVGMLPVPYLAYLFGSQQGAATLAYEGRNLTLLRAAPIGMGRVLAAKALGGLVMVIAITWAATLALGIRHEGEPIEIGQALLAATWLALGATVAAVAGAALTMEVDGDNPQRRVGCLGTVVTGALSLFFFLTNTAVVVWWVSRATFFALPRAFAGLLPVLDIALPVLALVSIGALIGAWHAGARRLSSDLSS